MHVCVLFLMRLRHIPLCPDSARTSKPVKLTTQLRMFCNVFKDVKAANIDNYKIHCFLQKKKKIFKLLMFTFFYIKVFFVGKTLALLKEGEKKFI